MYSNTHSWDSDILACLFTVLTQCGGNGPCKSISKNFGNYPFARTIRTRCLIYPVFAYDLPVAAMELGRLGIILHQSPDIPSDFHRSLRGIASVSTAPQSQY